MSAPDRDAIYTKVAPLLCRDVNALAPGLVDPVNRALAACEKAGLNVAINETYRRPEVQRLYYSIGRDAVTGAKVEETVTNAATAESSWHGYHAAVDVRDTVRGYDVPNVWWGQVAEHFLDEGLSWGGAWKTKDNPHFQSGQLPASPDGEDRADFRAGRIGKVWLKYSLGFEP